MFKIASEFVQISKIVGMVLRKSLNVIMGMDTVVTVDSLTVPFTTVAASTSQFSMLKFLEDYK